jgi:hypothetical protein
MGNCFDLSNIIFKIRRVLARGLRHVDLFFVKKSFWEEAWFVPPILSIPPGSMSFQFVLPTLKILG